MAIEWKGAHANSFAVGRAGFQPEAIVIHIMDGTLIGTDAWFNDARSKVAAHYGVGRNGAIHQYVRESDTAQHAGVVNAPSWRLIKRRSSRPGFVNPNFYTIGIEHEGKGLATDPWPQAMRDASLALVADIARRWSIPLDADHVIPHRAIRSTKPHCPGDALDLNGYIAALQTQPLPAAPAAVGHPFTTIVRMARTAFVRRSPDTQALPLRRIFADDEFKPVAVVTGETVNGNANWLQNKSREFVWAGNTDRPHPA